jgi:hypothetical protein
MPFDSTFDDIYKFGIKGAADDVGAYAERLDEQIFTEGMLDRIFTQISKADVIVADMTGRNPNVFYEVGYAHALDKIVILLTQNADDIPFDLKQRQHTVYGGKISVLRQELAPKLQWAIVHSRQQLGSLITERFSVRLADVEIPRSESGLEIPTLGGTVTALSFSLPIQVRNDSLESVGGISHVYLFCEKDSLLVPCEHKVIFASSGSYASGVQIPLGSGHVLQPTKTSIPQPRQSFTASAGDAPDGLSQQFRLALTFPGLPPGAVETAGIDLMFREHGIDVMLGDGARSFKGSFRLRLCSASQFHDYSFKMDIRSDSEEGSTEPAPDSTAPTGSKKGKRPPSRARRPKA